MSDWKLRPLSGRFCTNCWLTTVPTAGEMFTFSPEAVRVTDWMMDPTCMVKLRPTASCALSVRPTRTIC